MTFFNKEMLMTNNKIEVNFAHPRSAKLFTAEIGPQCTGQQAIEGLLVGDDQGPFLEQAPAGRPYELVLKKSKKAITPNMTFEQAGVESGDVIEVRQAGQGA